MSSTSNINSSPGPPCNITRDNNNCSPLPSRRMVTSSGSPQDDWSSALGSLTPTRRYSPYTPSLLSSGFSPTAQCKPSIWNHPINFIDSMPSTNPSTSTANSGVCTSMETSDAGTFNPNSPDTEYQVVFFEFLCFLSFF